MHYPLTATGKFNDANRVPVVQQSWMTKPIDECEMRSGDGWLTVGIAEALERRGEDMRCPECKGRLQPHREYRDGARAHFEHRRAHTGCSTKSRTFAGKRYLHPEALT